jgi:hypothetical protein
MTEDDIDISVPERGTASRGIPFLGSAPADEQNDKIIIRDPEGPVRGYKLTESVKDELEAPFRKPLEDHADWYEMWWEGTELCIEYEGPVREPESRGFQPQEDDDGNALPRYPEVPWMPREQTPQATLDMHEIMSDTPPDQRPQPRSFDKSLIPVQNITRIDMQERADKNPLQFEDLFVVLDEEPIGDIDDTVRRQEPDIDDVREMTDGKDTVREGARGNRYNL